MIKMGSMEIKRVRERERVLKEEEYGFILLETHSTKQLLFNCSKLVDI